MNPPTPESAKRFPLDWPLGWKRTPPYQRRRAMFSKHTQRTSQAGVPYRNKERLSLGDGLDRLQGELRRLNARNVVISSNLHTRQDGLPYASQGKMLSDPGIAVYFILNKAPRVLACDKWDSAADNLAAIAGHIEAIRAVDRYGVGTLEQAFAGYKALPADTAADWRVVLFGSQVPAPISIDDVQDAYKALARQRHPDITKDDGAAMAHLNRARDYAVAELVGD